MSNTDRPERSLLSRRNALVLGTGAFVAALVPLAARPRQEVVRRTVPVMGTLADLVVVHHDPRLAQVALDEAIEALRDVDRTMTRHVETSEVGQVNRLASTRPVAVGEGTAAVIREALAWAESSEGAFDPGVGRMIRLWDVTHRRTPPPEPAVRRLAGRRLYRALDLDWWRGRPVVRFTDPEVALDLGGIAKGHAVDRAVEALRARGIGQAVVEAGGDLYALGTARDGRPWRIGIRSPVDPSRLAAEIDVSDAAVATSGDYFQYFTYRGRRYHHLLDPTTAEPRQTPVHSLTVMAEHCGQADAAATALFGLDPARAATLLQARAPGARIVRVLSSEA